MAYPHAGGRGVGGELEWAQLEGGKGGGGEGGNDFSVLLFLLMMK